MVIILRSKSWQEQITKDVTYVELKRSMMLILLDIERLMSAPDMGLVGASDGDWAVICTDCAKTHKTIIVPIDFNE